MKLASKEQSETCVISCGENHSDLWEEFLDTCPDSSFYHRFGWKTINEECFGHKTFYLASIENEKVTGVFPMVFINSNLFGKIFCSMPFVNFGGPCSTLEETDQLLLEKAISLVDDNKADYLEIRSLKKIDGDLPSSEHKISATIDLDPDPEVIWENFSTKHRTNIRRAYKNGLSVEYGCKSKLDEFYDILSANWRDLGTPIYKKSYFETIMREFPDSIQIFIVYHDGIPIAAAFNGYYKGVVEGMWAATASTHRKLQPNYVLYWEMVKHACENGYRVYHLGRSTAESGGETFKKKWKANSKQLYWQYYLNGKSEIPQLNVNNSKYKLAIGVWRRMPVGLTTLIGPMISRSIP